MSRFSDPPPYPFLKWAGGKRQLISDLMEAIEAAEPFRRYHEPFLGGGALFFTLAREGHLRISPRLSDVNQKLIDTYLGVRDELEQVMGLLRQHQRRHGEAYYYEVRAQSPRTLARRAARVIYLNRTCFNGLYRENSKGQFNTPFGRYKNPRILDPENLLAVSETLAEVDIQACDFTSTLDLAQAGDLVYFDPPYTPLSSTSYFTAYSKGGFDLEAQRSLAGLARGLVEKGVKVILSNSMTELTADLYRDFYIAEVRAARSVNSNGERRGKISEALVTSFPLPDASDRPVRPPRPRRKASARPSAPGTRPSETVRPRLRRWLADNGYPDVLALIEEVEAEWMTLGKQTRRNWWEVLAGTPEGESRVVAGRPFPVLRAAQLRQGVPVSPAARCNDPDEPLPAETPAGA